jgi:hypothetical protein
MDPLTSSGLFATIVGLLCNYKSERSSTDLNEFMRWLEEKHHETIAASIRNNAELEDSLGTLLRINHDKLVDRLQRLDLLISSIAGKIDDFSGIAKAVHKKSIFSDQAISILTQFVESGAKVFLEHKNWRGEKDEYHLMDGATGTITYNEPRFMDDDLDTLVYNDLLTLETSSKGTKSFFVTRSALAFVDELKKSAQ